MATLLTRITRALDAFGDLTGRAVAWLIVVLAAVVAADVTLRYAFQSGSIALQELEWQLFGAIFLLGAAYTLRHDGHVRVDVVYRSRHLNDRQRALIDLVGTLALLLPFSALVIWTSWPFVLDAFQSGERSPDPGGLPHRWIPKALIPIGFALLFLQGISEVLKNGLRLAAHDLTEDSPQSAQRERQ